MKQIESEIYRSWADNTHHTAIWGRSSRGRVFVVPRDEVRVEPSGDRLYRLWGTNMCYQNNLGVFYFYVTDTGNHTSCNCMSQTSKGRINALLPYGSVVQKNYQNYFQMFVSVNGKKPSSKETKLEVGYWYKLKDGKAIKIKGKPLALTD